MGRAYRIAMDALEKGEPYDADALAREIFAISNRGYTPGFLVGNPGEKGIWFEKNAEIKEEEFIGIVRGYDAETGLARIEVKNRFDLGDRVRLIGPRSETEFVLERIVGPEGDEKTCAHGGSFDVDVAVPGDPGEFALLRKLPKR